MKNEFEKNFTADGYLMNYEKLDKLLADKNKVLQFKIELKNISPLIWRRILVPIDCNFWDLHIAIQDAIGWYDAHLHRFEIKGKGKQKKTHIGIPDFNRFSDLQEVYPGWEIPALNYFNDLGVEAEYIYDYGDSWHHSVKLEGYIYREKKTKYPICIGGERACPPEDCGGERGYNDMLNILFDPKNERHEEMKTWVGEDWDAEVFDSKKVRFTDPYKRWKEGFLS